MNDEQRTSESEVDREMRDLELPADRVRSGINTHAESLTTNPRQESNDFELALEHARGTLIGQYKLLEKIGEGGFGVVYAAEQKEPIRRKVALKIIKPGMGTREVIARFETERQALTLMDHRNIARVIDGGATATGHPFFVMELVQGIPITDYCDQHKLDVKQRLKLFVDVCHAVQHAHHKGIIHRDVKPSNILVELKDNSAVPKVIDFGVAKATKLHLTDHTVHTLQAQMIGTPLYMSPEQADKSALDVDTRTDIYSLGVLLYELLTGTTPIDRKRLREANAMEFIRMICDEESVRPSIQASVLGDQSVAIADKRSTEPRKLHQLLKGDLDWIVIKALEKDRSRRYETASDFARDIERFLDDEPVSASPPSQIYRLRKFARRNKVAVGAASIVIATLLTATVVSAMMAIRARQSAEKAQFSHAAELEVRNQLDLVRQQALIAEKEKTRMLESSREKTDKAFEKSLEILNEVMVQMGKSGLSDMPRMQQLRRDVLEKAAVQYEAIIDDIQWEGERYYELMRNYAGLLQGLARIRRWVGANDEAFEAYQMGDDAFVQLEKDFDHHGPEINLGRAALNYGQAMTLRTANRSDESESAFRRSIQFATRAIDDQPEEARFHLCRALNQLGYLLAPTNRWKEAGSIFREAIQVGSEAHQEFPSNLDISNELARAMHNLANYLNHTQRPEESEKYFREAITTYRLLEKEDIDGSATASNCGVKSSLAGVAADFAIFLDKTGKPDEATQLRADALAISRVLAADYPSVPYFQRGLVIHLGNTGLAEVQRGDHKSGRLKYKECEKILRDLISRVPENLEFRAILANQLSNHGRSYAVTKDYQSAELLLEESVRQWQVLVEKQPEVALHKVRKAQALHAQAICMMNTGDQLQAIELCGQAIRYLTAASEDNPNSAFLAQDKAAIWYLLAKTHGLHLGNEQEAIEASAQAVRFATLANQDIAEAYQFHGLLLVSALEESLRNPDQVIDLSKHFMKTPDADGHLVVGIAHFRNGDFEESRKSLNLSLNAEAQPNVWTRLYMALNEQKLGAREQALVRFTEAQELLTDYDFDAAPKHESRRLKLLVEETTASLSPEID